MNMRLETCVLLFLMINFASAELDSEDGLDDLDEEERKVYYFGDDYDVGRAGCGDSLPAVMKSNNNCKKLKKTCSNMKSSCSKTLGNALGSSNNAKKCKTALKSWQKNRKVNNLCKETCNKCANGGWSSYGTYTSCTVTCGGGLKYRTRTCTNPAPFGGGDSCSGSETQSTACNSDACPTTTTTTPVATNGTWMEWSEWSPCSASCNNGTGSNGTRTRERECTAPTNGGLNCTQVDKTSSSTETEFCNQDVPCQTCFQEYMAGGLELVLQKIEEVSQKIAALEEAHKNNTAKISMNERRHQNVDGTFRNLCPLIDTIFDNATAPGGVQYDCCQEEFSGTPGQIGEAMMCLTQSTMDLMNPAPFIKTERGVCATSCGFLPLELISGYSDGE